MLTEGPFCRIYEYSKMFVGKTVCAVTRTGRIECEWSMELDLTFDREIMERLQ